VPAKKQLLPSSYGKLDAPASPTATTAPTTKPNLSQLSLVNLPSGPKAESKYRLGAQLLA
jgi:hypothetical protein